MKSLRHPSAEVCPTALDRWGLYEPQTEHDACGIGFVAHLKGIPSHDIVEQALTVLERLSHRGACGCDPNTGDGAGILVQIPDRFFSDVIGRRNLDLPRRRRCGVGMVFLPHDRDARARCEAMIEEVVEQEGQRFLGWRDVPVDPGALGELARETMPVIRQCFIGRRRVAPSAFEAKLLVIRKLAENGIRDAGFDRAGQFHFCSLSAETIVYKGLFLADQLPRFFSDLGQASFESAIAVVHSRFSTNTLPSWDRAQPLRYMCHNGEINTRRGNINWMRARRSQLQSAKFGGSLERLQPILVPDGSDSAQFDNMLELLRLGGRPLPHAMMMMIPEAWQNDEAMSDQRRSFYRYASALTEPWDGPAAVVFSDGSLVGATLDRNGLRPARWLTTTDDRVVLASEAGVLDVPPHQVRSKGRLRPGRMFVVDTEEGRILDDDGIKHDVSIRFPYRRWLDRNEFDLDELPPAEGPTPLQGRQLGALQRAFGYTDEDLRILLQPMAEQGKEPLGSMGNDAPLAVLSDQSPLLFDYFHQLFAQVTNPAIDPIREALVMSLCTYIGSGGNPLEETPEQCHRIAIRNPVLTNEDLAAIKGMQVGLFETLTLPLTFPASEGAAGLQAALDRLCHSATDAIDEGFNVLVLSDRDVDADHAAIPSLLAVSAVHHHLVREGIRMRAGLVLETAEAREVHHFALLLGYGAAAINPYLTLDSLRAMHEAGDITVDLQTARQNYVRAVGQGLLKVMSKMGISTLESYTGAQLFEAVGLGRALVEQHFTGTPSRLGGIGLHELGQELLDRHARGWAEVEVSDDVLLPTGGRYQWRARGERHKWNPETIAKLRQAVLADDDQAFAEFFRLADDENRGRSTLRGLLELDDGTEPVPLDQVESTEAILQRFCTGAMSFGSISAPAHESLAIAMNRLRGKSNSGEGGEEADRYLGPDAADAGIAKPRRSAIKQVASGRFGVHTEYLVHGDDLQIKIAQGAKPGEGGHLPGPKVTERIAKVRCSTPGVSLISPPPHHDIYSIEDLSQLIYDLQTVNPRARVSVKLVSEVGVGTVAAGVAKAGAACIVIAGASGGTGASALSSIKHTGLPWELGLAEAQQVLVQNGLRGRVRLQVDGGMRTARDVVIGALLGAEEFGFSTAPLVALGCIMLRKCHEGTCSVGIATQDPELIDSFTGEPEHVELYLRRVAEEVRELMARLGFRTMDEMVGRVDKLKPQQAPDHWKAERLDLTPLLQTPPVVLGGSPVLRCHPEPRPMPEHLDRDLLQRCQQALDGQGPVQLTSPVRNTDRAVGGLMAGEIVRRHGGKGLPDGSIVVHFRGSAGQSFGAFACPGMTLALEGEANDYVGKGLSGGRISIFAPEGASFEPEQNVIVGNVVLYGATSGEAYIAGTAGERFAVRNSGAKAVVEGVGDHGCEYMTGGVVVVLGETGRNFAAGMSGGMAFVFDEQGAFARLCNPDTVMLEPVAKESDIWLLRHMLETHLRYTGSARAQRILEHWDFMLSRFVKVMPVEYKRVLEQQRDSWRTRASGGSDSRASLRGLKVLHG